MLQKVGNAIVYVLLSLLTPVGMAALVIALMATGVMAAENGNKSPRWSIEEWNAQVNETNFVVNNGSCSGTLMDPEERLIITNYHCINNMVRVVEREDVSEDGYVRKRKEREFDEVVVEQHSYNEEGRISTSAYQTEIVAAEKRWDLALLQMKAENIPHTRGTTLLPEDQKLLRAEEVWAVGNPRGLDASISKGIVANTARSFKFSWTGRHKTPMIQFTALIAPGSSGGALYNAYGYLVGIPAAGRDVLFFGIPVRTIRDFVVRAGFPEVVGVDPEEVEEVEEPAEDDEDE